MRLAAAASAIDELCNHLDYEAATSANIVRGLQRLRRHMLALLPLFASIEDRMVGARLAEAAMPATSRRNLHKDRALAR